MELWHDGQGPVTPARAAGTSSCIPQAGQLKRILSGFMPRRKDWRRVSRQETSGQLVSVSPWSLSALLLAKGEGAIRCYLTIETSGTLSVTTATPHLFNF